MSLARTQGRLELPESLRAQLHEFRSRVWSVKMAESACAAVFSIAAAVVQVAEAARRRDFRDAVPNPRHRLWAWLAAVPSVVALGLFLVVPAAATNAWARLVAPWRDTPRYTFAAIERLPSKLVVAHG